MLNKYIKQFYKSNFLAFKLDKMFFCEKLIPTNSKPKMIRVSYDSNYNKKITYEEYDPTKKELKSKSTETLEKNVENTYFKDKNNLSNFYGSFELEDSTKKKKKARSIKPEEINNSKETLSKGIHNKNTDLKDKNDNEEDFTEMKENLINYNQFFSDSCRIYVKGGDGGKGLFSLNKGTMYDNCNIKYE